jgi:hypothetical protein
MPGASTIRREAPQDRDDIRTECAGVNAGCWFANTARPRSPLVACRLGPAVRRDDTYRLSPNVTLQVDIGNAVEPPPVQLISSGTPAYGVTAIA